MAGMWSNNSAHALLVGLQTDTASLEGSLAVSYNTRQNYDMMQQLCSLVFTQMS